MLSRGIFSKQGRNKEGFTLVELAIVIVIIGLLVGGVLQGQELIQQSKLRSLMKSVTEYEIAIITFKDKYRCLPGDCRNAQAYLDSSTLNGNGNMRIDFGFSADPAEMLLAWQHLTLAKLLKGSYTGLLDAEKVAVNFGVNIPAVQGFSNAGAWLLFRDNTNFNSGTSLFGQANRHVLYFGSTFGNPQRLYGGFLDPVSAYQVDSKIDDGNPGTGKMNANTAVTSSNSTLANNCTTSVSTQLWDGSIPTEYNLTGSRPVCGFILWQDF